MRKHTICRDFSRGRKSKKHTHTYVQATSRQISTCSMHHTEKEFSIIYKCGCRRCNQKNCERKNDAKLLKIIEETIQRRKKILVTKVNDHNHNHNREIAQQFYKSIAAVDDWLNQPHNASGLSQPLTLLSVGSAFNQPLPQSLPQSLTQLCFGSAFNQPLTHLSFDCCSPFNQSPTKTQCTMWLSRYRKDVVHTIMCMQTICSDLPNGAAIKSLYKTIMSYVYMETHTRRVCALLKDHNKQ